MLKPCFTKSAKYIYVHADFEPCTCKVLSNTFKVLIYKLQ